MKRTNRCCPAPGLVVFVRHVVLAGLVDDLRLLVHVVRLVLLHRVGGRHLRANQSRVSADLALRVSGNFVETTRQPKVRLQAFIHAGTCIRHSDKPLPPPSPLLGVPAFTVS